MGISTIITLWCNSCSDHDPDLWGQTAAAVRKAGREVGWVRLRDDNDQLIDLCPRCARSHKRP